AAGDGLGQRTLLLGRQQGFILDFSQVQLKRRRNTAILRVGATHWRDSRFTSSAGRDYAPTALAMRMTSHAPGRILGRRTSRSLRVVRLNHRGAPRSVLSPGAPWIPLDPRTRCESCNLRAKTAGIPFFFQRRYSERFNSNGEWVAPDDHLRPPNPRSRLFLGK